MIWPSARRAWDLLHGAKVNVDKGLLASFANGNQRVKRGADDAFGSEKISSALPRDTFDGLDRSATEMPAPLADSAGNRMLAHMLGLDIPGIEPSTSYLPGYEWWPRANPTIGSDQSSQAYSTPSPNNISNHSSPSASMPIPFSFDQTQNYWMGGMMGNTPNFEMAYLTNPSA